MRRSFAVAFVAAMAASLLLVAAFHDRFWYAPDEGAYADVARRMLAGQGLNREVADLHAGYVNFVHAGAFALFGERLLSLRYPLALVTLLQAAAAFALLRRRGAWTAAAAAVAVTALGVLQFLDPTAHWYALFFYFLVVLVLQEVPREAPWRLPLAGFIVATQFLFRQLTGVLTGIGVVAYALLEAAPEPGRPAAGRGLAPVSRLTFATLAVGLTVYVASWTDVGGFLLFGVWPLALLVVAAGRAPVRDGEAAARLGRLAAGAAAGVVPLLLYHLARGSVGGWFEDAVLSALAQSRSAFLYTRNFASWLIPEAGGTLLAADGPRAVVNALFWLALPFAALLLGAWVTGTLLQRRRPDPLPFLAVFYAVVTLHDQVPIYLFFSLPATLAGLLWLAAGAGPRRRRAAAAGALALSAIAVAFHAGQPLTRSWDEMLAGERRALVASDGLPRCGLHVAPEELALYRELAGLIERESSPGETILAVPCNPELYFLTGRDNPLRFFNFGFGVRDEEQLAEVLETLRRDPPRLVIYDPADKYNTDLTRRLMVWVRDRYEPAGEVERFVVYRRPPEAGAAGGAIRRTPPPPG